MHNAFFRSFGFLLFASRCLCQSVTTTNGQIIGHTASSAKSVFEFLGVPYAQPPLGKLRFSPPQPFIASYGTHQASQWGFSCPQSPSAPSEFPGLTPQGQRIIDNFAGSDKIPQDEDCLTLNIWSRYVGSSDLKPVLIFLYGGRFAAGNTNTPFYGGANFAQHEDVVVVTINYRVNIFGFPGGPDSEQNLGLMDQRLAVEWIRDNALVFGGDPSKLTIWGQSSGGVAVDYWSYAYAEDPIVHAFISDSGNAFSFPMNPPEVQTENWFAVSKAVGCGGHGNTVPCMRTVSWEKLEAAAAEVPPSVSSSSPVRSTPPLYPRVDGVLVFDNYESLSESGAFARLPYLLGNNNFEQGFYVLGAYANGVNVTSRQGEKFLLQSFTCPTRLEALDRRKYDVPVFRYRYHGDWTNIRLYAGSGAYHGTELEMIFGNSGSVSGISPSKAELRTTRFVQHAWATFANDPVHGLVELGWPVFEQNRKTLAEIAYKNRPDITLVRPDVYDATCPSIELGSQSS